MAIPIKYNLRNLAVRKITTLLTVFGIGLVVAALLTVLALSKGLTSVFTATGSSMNVLVLRKNSQSEVQSSVTKDQVALINTMPGIEKDIDQQPLASAEAVVVVNLEKKGGGVSSVTIRGVSDKGLRLRPNFKLVEGRMFNPGVSEVIVSRGLSERLKGMTIGDSIHVGLNELKIVGIFDAGGTAADSEIWSDAEGVQAVFKRTSYSSVLARVSGKGAQKSFISALETDPRLSLDGIVEKAYYDEQTAVADPIKFIGMFIGIIMAIGASFGAMNTMYASISTRTMEIATLRVLGFSRISILISFVTESMIVSFVGGVLGCVMGLIIARFAISDVTGTTNFNTFSEVVFAFRVTPELMLIGLLLSLLIGLLGGILPASQAAFTKITLALRQKE